VEVEFASSDDAERFSPPEWFGPELTDVPGWTNAELSRALAPPDPPAHPGEGRGVVVVVGAVNVDLVVAAPRLPGPGETVVGPGVERHGGGKGANAAVAASRAGAAVHLAAAVGHDDTGAAALDELRADGVDTSAVATLDAVPTGMALIVVDPAGENQIAVGAGANAAVEPERVAAVITDRAAPGGCVLVSTEIPAAAVSAAVRAAITAGLRCVLNPAPVLPELAGLVGLGAIVTPNRTELADLLAALGEDVEVPDDVTAAARRLAGHNGAPVVVTLGGDGALVAHPDAEPVHVAARPATVRDTTGAGDTFNGVLAAALAAGHDLDAAVARAMAAAAISVGAVGARTGMPHAAAIDQATSNQRIEGSPPL